MLSFCVCDCFLFVIVRCENVILLRALEILGFRAFSGLSRGLCKLSGLLNRRFGIRSILGLGSISRALQDDPGVSRALRPVPVNR